MDANLPLLLSLIIRCLSVGVILFYVIPKQFAEVLRPKDWLTRLRWQLLLLFIFTVIATIPALAYQFARLRGVDSQVLRAIASITANLSVLGTTIIIVLIYHYRKDDNK